MKKSKLLFLAPVALATLVGCNKNTKGAYTIKFESNGGTSYKDVAVIHGEKLAKPADPIRTGYTFVYWCTDQELNKEYNFNTPVECDFTLYAKWVETPVIKVESVVISHSALTMYVDDTFQLGATVLPENAADKSVTWTSSNEDYATVSSTGLVTAKKTTNDFNEVNIIVSTNDGHKLDVCNLTIERDLSKVVDSIEVVEYPLLKQTENNKLDLGGLEVMGIMKDGSTRILEKNEYETSPKDGTVLEDVGRQTIDIICNSNPQATTSFNITVRSKKKTIISLETTKNPTKTTYNEGECFDPTGLEVKATYLDGHTGTLSISDCSFAPSLKDKLTAEDDEITVSPKEFPNVKTYVDIKVNKASVDALPSYLKLEPIGGKYGNALSRNFDSKELVPDDLEIKSKYVVNGKELSVDSLIGFSETNYQGTNSLKKITLPDSVKYILKNCFKDCKQLTTVSFGEDSQLVAIDTGSFESTTSLTSFTIPKEVNLIMYEVFKESGLKSLEFKNTNEWYILDNYIPIVIGVDEQGKQENAAKMLDCSGETPDSWGYFGLDKTATRPEYLDYMKFYGDSINNRVSVLYVGAEQEVVEIPEYVDGAYIIGEGFEEGIKYKVNEICVNGFCFRDGIKKVIIPEGVTIIQERAFQGCHDLEEIVFSGDSQLQEVLLNAFESTFSLKSITFPSSLKIIDPEVFKYSGVTSVTINTNKQWSLIEGDEIDISNPETNATNLRNCDEEGKNDNWGLYGICEKGYLD